MKFDPAKKWWLIQLKVVGDNEWPNTYHDRAYVSPYQPPDSTATGGRLCVYASEAAARAAIESDNLDRRDQQARPIEVDSEVIRKFTESHKDMNFDLTGDDGSTEAIEVASVWPHQ